MKPSTSRKIFRSPAIQISAVLLAITAMVFLMGSLLTAPAPSAVATLSADFPVESIQIPAADGSMVHGWLSRGYLGDGVVLLVHSMRSNRLEMLGRARFLRNQGYSVLFIDLYAHGETPGENISFGLHESDSVVASVNYLRRTFPRERIGAIGASLGAAAIVLAKQNLNLDAVILESLHPTIEEAVENRLRLHFGEYGTVLMPVILAYLSLQLNTAMDQLSPIHKIDHLRSPVLFIAGTRDAHTTQPETERLYAAARTPKELWVVPGAGHFNMHSYAGREYEYRVSAFLAQYLRPVETDEHQ
ncbi:alpha/beta hydrolase [Nitrosomonas sp. JL21]|uniref:alpha/beta hydrolase n=1 Tax=Nitrosomonas sp. JL21 TaxID=153949 RepID=UPI00136838B1|nr:alpha/beta fold hydrolase [Nitrosomonas sp. JL21]MBL8498344.1 dienelactone hydrolase family protein [Nitrosomonas sp.]MXS77561.1 alpha/beta hydrolase [Nitrosomonas sp. JL21]